MALEEFTPLPSGCMSGFVHTCLYMFTYAKVIVLLLQSLKRDWGNPAMKNTFQIKLKFPSVFFHFSPWSKLAEGASWFVSVYSLLMYTPFTETCSELTPQRSETRPSCCCDGDLTSNCLQWNKLLGNVVSEGGMEAALVVVRGGGKEMDD